jgi:hypothetical protein
LGQPKRLAVREPDQLGGELVALGGRHIHPDRESALV